jgi:chromosome segregation ATPase
MKEYIEYYEKLRPIVKKFDEFRKAQEEITKRDDTMKKLKSEIDTLNQKGNLTEEEKAKLAAKEAALNQQKKEKENLEQLHGKSIDEAMAKTLGGEKQKETALQQEVEKLKKELAAALAPAPTASSRIP